jgi:intracellular septation protein
MKLLYDLFPLILFFVAYKMYDIYVATGVAIVASFIQLTAFWVKNRRFETIHVVTLCLLVVFGGLTIILRDPVFIKWKTTIVNWIFCSVLFYSHFAKKRTVFEVITRAQVKLPAEVWRKLNLHWAIFFLFIGTLNLYVAFYFALDLDEARREEIWVNFKVFGVLGMTLVFLMFEFFIMMRFVKRYELDDLEEKRNDLDVEL